MALLTNRAVEDRVVRRVTNKAGPGGTCCSFPQIHYAEFPKFSQYARIVPNYAGKSIKMIPDLHIMPKVTPAYSAWPCNKAAIYGQDISEELPESMVGRCILTLSNPH
jgi:hypothetical protein